MRLVDCDKFAFSNCIFHKSYGMTCNLSMRPRQDYQACLAAGIIMLCK